MYVIKNALRCISRAKGRNVLIGIIVLVIAVASCVALSIRQAAEDAGAELLEDMTVTATISFDRQSLMQNFRGEGTPSNGEENSGGGRMQFDRDSFSQMMGEASTLTLEEYQIYADAPSVKDFYWTLTVSADGGDSLEPVSASSEESEDADSQTQQNSGNGFGGMMSRPGTGNMMGGGRGFFSQGDFQLIGYSSEAAMTDFISGVSSVTDGEVFEEGTKEYHCMISEELAAYNGLAVGDTVTVSSLENEEETYSLTVVGIFTNSSANEIGFSLGGFSASDPANQILMSYEALQGILDQSEVFNGETEEEDAYSPLTGSLSGTYVFADVESYEAFEAEARELGLSDSYTVSSQDVSDYKSRLTPLNTLSTMAGWFLLVILVIGAVILIVLNIFNVRERKYEIGVLCAMGMKKSKVAVQFLTEIFVVTLAAVLIGVVAGGLVSVPLTNTLLENQVSSQNEMADNVEMNFGRGEGANRENPMENGGMRRPQNVGQAFRAGADYITEIDSAMNLTVVFQMFAIAILLTLAGGAVSMLSIMRYDPLKILSNRD